MYFYMQGLVITCYQCISEYCDWKGLVIGSHMSVFTSYHNDIRGFEIGCQKYVFLEFIVQKLCGDLFPSKVF